MSLCGLIPVEPMCALPWRRFRFPKTGILSHSSFFIIVIVIIFISCHNKGVGGFLNSYQGYVVAGKQKELAMIGLKGLKNSTEVCLLIRKVVRRLG